MVSIIMPVLNEATILRATLETLLQQAGNYKIIIVG
jgi:glycosyltransferase involved in cell wall biosynthesis